ncbi:MAG TPA: four helix bundle protein [Chloroflexota bacterium]|nr:four helix bundle protein [Chloroflexota bacterium]
MGDYRKLKVWHKAHQPALFTYGVTERLPQAERFGLTSQMRRAAVSVPANLAEGSARLGDRDMARILGIAIGSANELHYHFRLAADLGWISQETDQQAEKMTAEVRAMLDGLRRKVVGLPRASREPH